ERERGKGGGALDLVRREIAPTTRAGAAKWIGERGSTRSDEPRPKSNGNYSSSAKSEKPKKRVHGDRHPTLGKPAVTYPYHDANGNLIFEACRFEPKDFRPRQPDGNGSWLWDLQHLHDKLVVYRLPEITEAIAQEGEVAICEGEKDADAAAEIGLNATCCQGGSSGWRPIYNETFRGANVRIIPHNDDAGRKFAETVAANLSGIAARIRILKLWESWKECPEKG